MEPTSAEMINFLYKHIHSKNKQDTIDKKTKKLFYHHCRDDTLRKRNFFKVKKWEKLQN